MKENIRRLLTMDTHDDGQMAMRRRRDSKGRYMGYEDYSGRNGRQIGFSTQNRMRGGQIYQTDTQRRYSPVRQTNRMSLYPMDTMDGGTQAKQSMQTGMASIEEYIDEPLTIGEAMKWAESLPDGPEWKTDEVKQIARSIGAPADGEEFAEFYAVMNALHSDYCKVFQKYGIEDPNLYAELAKAWIDDEDAVPNKSAVYYRFIVEE